MKFIEGSTNQSVILKSRETNAQHRPYLVCRYTEGSGNTSGGEDTGEGENTGGGEGTEENEYAAEFEYINYYDCKMADRTDLIDDAVQLADKAFKKQFNIAFSIKGDPIFENDLTTVCSDGTPCDCLYNSIGGYYYSHHHDITWISTQLLAKEDISENERIIYWTDWPVNTFCTIEDNNHYYVDEIRGGNPKIAVVCNFSAAIHFMNLLPDNKVAEQDLACMSLCLIHETAHTFSLDEQDKAEEAQRCDGLNTSGMQCVMEGYPLEVDIDDATAFYERINDQGANAFCNGCENNLRALLQSKSIIP